MTHPVRKFLMLFVDGLGMGSTDPKKNPIYSGVCPMLARVLTDKAVAIDASMGVPGIPQSATGTTALLTGVNAAMFVGRHVEGFPGPTLKEILRRDNIFKKLRAAGLRGAFSNAYGAHSQEEVSESRLLSATTVAALAGLGCVRLLEDLVAGRAVYHDLTREHLREKGFDVPIISPSEAAGHLTNIANDHDFTLFEYFLTDRAGHDTDPDKKKRVLSIFDQFLATLLHLTARLHISVVLTSDHGNIEDGTGTGHTSNPVPFAVIGDSEREICVGVRSITDVAPSVVAWLRDGGSGGS